jgi:hypothetical protein
MPLEILPTPDEIHAAVRTVLQTDVDDEALEEARRILTSSRDLGRTIALAEANLGLLAVLPERNVEALALVLAGEIVRSSSAAGGAELTKPALGRALLALLNARSNDRTVEKARDVLHLSGSMFWPELDQPLVVAAVAKAPSDRLAMLARLLPHDGIDNARFPELESRLLGLLGRVVDGGIVSRMGPPRADALVALLHRLGAIARVPARDLEWTLGGGYTKPFRLYTALSAWCEAHDPVPDALLGAIQKLRDQDDEFDSPILDRLAAWTSPTARGMIDLAVWENGHRLAGEPKYRAAADRWSRGEFAPSDEEILAPSMAPEASCCAHAVELAVKRHPERALEALDQAIEESREQPVIQVLLAGWRQMVLGER